MGKILTAGIAAILVTAAVGCEALVGLLRPSETTVVLVNNSDFDVEVVLFYDDDQNILEALLTDVGQEMQITLAAGEQSTFSRDCDDLQAIIIEDADLLLIGQLGPEANTDVLRDGDDFGCGDTITFTFDHSDVLLDFDISVAIE